MVVEGGSHAVPIMCPLYTSGLEERAATAEHYLELPFTLFISHLLEERL